MALQKVASTETGDWYAVPIGDGIGYIQVQRSEPRWQAPDREVTEDEQLRAARAYALARYRSWHPRNP